MHVRRRILQVSNSQSIVKYSSRMLVIQGWSANILIVATGTTIILMLLFLCLKSSLTHKKHNEVEECQGSSDICEKMSRIWPWAPQPPSPEQSIIGTSCSEGILEEVIEKGKVTSVAVQIPPIYKEEKEAEKCLNQYKYENSVEDTCVYKSTDHPIENMRSSNYFLYPFTIKEKSLDHTNLNISPNSYVNLNQYSSNTHQHVNCCFSNSNQDSKYVEQETTPEQLNQNKSHQVMPKLTLQESVTTNKNNNFQHVPVKITQNKETYVNFPAKKMSQYDPPTKLSQFKTGNNSAHQSQISPHPIKLEYADKGSSESSTQSVSMDVNKQNSIESSSEEKFPKAQKSLRFAYQNPMKLVKRNASDEILMTNSTSRKGSFKSSENLTAQDILDISTSRHKSDALSDEIGYTPLGSLHSNEKSKESIVKRLSQFSSLFPEDPKNPVPKDPSRLPVNQSFEKKRMSSTQLSEKISEIGSKTATGGALFKYKKRSSNQDDVHKVHTIFNFGTPNTFQASDHKSNDNIMLNRDSVSTDSSKSAETIEINIHRREMDKVSRTKRHSDSVDDISENESISIELYNIIIPSSSDESQNPIREEINKGEKYNPFEICGSSGRKALKYDDVITQPTLEPVQRNMNQSKSISNKISKYTTKNVNRFEGNSVQALPPKILHSQELCCLQFSNSANELHNRILPNNLDIYENTNKNITPVVAFQQQYENMDNELNGNSSVETSDSIVFYNQHFNNNASSDIFFPNIPETEHHGQTLPHTSTPELIRERQSDSVCKISNCNPNIKNEVITTKKPLQKDENTNLPKFAAVLKWRIVMEKSKTTQ